MRYFGTLAAVASVVMLGACGGSGEKAPAADSTSTAGSTAAPTDSAASSSASATPAAGAVAAAPITGKTWEVKMIGDDKGYRFEPAAITIKAGDGIKYVNVSGGPHNVAFNAADVPADSKAQLAANMPNTTAELSSPMLVQPNEAYTVSFGNIKPGTYTAHCTPHMAMNMKQVITVQ